MKPYGKFWQEADRGFYLKIHLERMRQHTRFCRWFKKTFLPSEHLPLVCEIGCGYGVFYPEWFESMGMIYTGVDLSQKAIEYCQANHPGEFYCADVTLWNPRQPLFDLVFSQGTIDNTPEMDRFLRTHARLSRQWIYVTAYRGFFPKLKKHTYTYNKQHQCWYNDISPSQARQALVDEGFTDIGTWPLDGETVIIARREYGH